MWSVFRKTISIYLGHRCAVVRVSAQPEVVLQWSADWPLAKILQKLDAEKSIRESAGTRIRRHKLRITLGANYCPAFGVDIPNEITQLDELQAFAKHAAAQELGCPADQLLVLIDPLHRGMSAALPTLFVSELQAWAQSKRWDLEDLSPMWARAAESVPASEVTGRQALVVREPGLQTCLPLLGEQWRLVQTQMEGHMPTKADPLIDHWMKTTGLVGPPLIVTFHLAEPATPSHHLAHWKKHWSFQ